MASLKFFCALFIVLFAVATATTYTTTVTTITTTEDEGSSSQQGRCRQEIQSKDFNMCEKFFSMDQQQGGGGRLRMIVDREGQEQGMQEMQNRCCQQLKQVNPMCRCAAIEDVMKDQMRGEQSMQSPKMQKVMEKARNLPRDCNFDQPQECRFDMSF